MIARGTPTIDLAELIRVLKAVEPAVLLVPPRLLRRVIKHDRQVGGIGLLVPHRRSHVIGRDRLLPIASREELGIPLEMELPPVLILLAQPSPATLATTPRDALLLKYWRMVFHARVHIALNQRWAEGGLTPARLRERIAAIGTTAFEEIRAVLRQEEFLLPPNDDREVYGEFAAVYLELRSFDAGLLGPYFPGIRHFEAINALLALDLDADHLFAATRPEGAPDPVPPEEPLTDEADVSLSTQAAADTDQPAYRLFKRLNQRARKKCELGNVVGAAIARTQAIAVAPPKRREEMRTAARADLERLAVRLQAAVGLASQDAVQWRKALNPLLKVAATSFWPMEARLLYDLQKVCIDHERELFAVDLVEWALSLFRRPLKRPVPCQRQVLLLKHLRQAGLRLKSARLTDPDRQRLNGLFYGAVRHCEERLRQGFRPVIQATLEEIGLRPRNLPERVALHKLIEELLDRIVERGFVGMGDLRDALSRNNLKLPDLAGPPEFVRGDRLIRADRHLARMLDGVYRGGEIYLRWLQRLSSLAFGTLVGRFLTLYLILPFGGAFVVLEGLQHVLGHVVPAGAHAVAAEAAAADTHEPPIHLVTPATLTLLGLFLLALLHLPLFRRAVWRGLQMLSWGARRVLVDGPRYLLGLPAVRAVLESRPFGLFWKWIAKPLAPAALAGAGLWWSGADPNTIGLLGGAVYGTTAVFLNTRLGRDLEEALTDWLVNTWERFHIDFLPGLFRLVMAVFKQILEMIDRVIYRVDEWLRFRKGDSRLSLVVKPVLGLFWFGVTYLARIYVNLMIEPTVNPIKHFPVVTVSAKLILPAVPTIADVTATLLAPLGRVIAHAIAWVNVFFIPGVFGFLVWELKENWRLYESNRAAGLGPVMVGHHGETLVRLLRPGLHSGTIPKLFAKLRHAERTAHRGGDWRPARKHREALYHVKKSIHHFVDRELVFLLNQSPCWQPLRLAVAAVELATNRIRIGLECRSAGAVNLEIAFDIHDGWLVAGVVEPGWLDQLTEPQRQALLTALAGLYKLAGVDLVRDGTALEVAHPMRDGPKMQPLPVEGEGCQDEPALPAPPFLFRQVAVPWSAWVETWETGRAAETLG